MENLTTDQWIAIIGHILKFLSILVTILLAWLGYKWAQKNWLKRKKIENEELLQQRKIEQANWLKQKQIENENSLLRMKYDTKIAAYKGAWRVLSYLSDRDNPRGMFEEYGDGDDKELCLYPDRAKAFLVALEQVFFAEGHGLFWPQSLRKEIFIFRSKVISILHAKEQNVNDDGLLRLPAGLAKQFRRTQQALILEVRELMKMEEMG